MTNALYNSFKLKLAQAGINLSTDTLNIALLTSAYTPNIDTDTYFGDINSREASGTNYTAGGQALTTQALTNDLTNNRTYLTADNPHWDSSTITARYAVFYKNTGNPATSPLIGYITFLDGNGNPADKSTNGDSFYITLAAGSAGGLFDLT